MSNAKLEVLTPRNSQLIIIDHQPQMAFGVQSMDRQSMKNNVVGLAKAAKIFDVPTTITTVESDSFSGYTYPELLDVFPGKQTLERTSMNSWDDQKVRDALAANGRKKIVVAGLWTEVCNTTFALCAMLEGDYEIYMVADASGGTTKEAHDYAMQRMVQAGVVPVTWQQVMLEWQRDWKNRETYDEVMAVAKEHSGAMAWGSTMPIRWSTRPRNARQPRTNRWLPCTRRSSSADACPPPVILRSAQNDFRSKRGQRRPAAGMLAGHQHVQRSGGSDRRQRADRMIAPSAGETFPRGHAPARQTSEDNAAGERLPPFGIAGSAERPELGECKGRCTHLQDGSKP